MKRREFVTLLGGAAAWPLAARAQQGERMRRIGVLLNVAADDPMGQARVAAFAQGLQAAGWYDGRNVRIDTRGAGADPDNHRKYAAELISLGPDVVLASTTAAVVQLQRASRTVPIVFVSAIDPLGSGLITSMARPGGNITGFVIFEYALAAKWLELLKEIAPGVKRAAVLRDATVASGIGQFAAIQAAGSIGMELSAIDLRDAGEIERAIADFAQRPNGGLILTASQFGTNHPGPLAALAVLPNASNATLYENLKSAHAVCCGAFVAYDTKRTCQSCRSMSAFGGRAPRCKGFVNRRSPLTRSVLNPGQRHSRPSGDQTNRSGRLATGPVCDARGLSYSCVPLIAAVLPVSAVAISDTGE